MTPAEVERVLRVPPGDYRTRDVQTLFVVTPPPGTKQVVWHGDKGAVLIHFDSDDRLVHAVFVNREAGQETFLEKVAQWLGLP